MNFAFMSDYEIVSYVEKFGTEEQRILVAKLYEHEPEIDWSECPYCDDHYAKVACAQESLSMATGAIQDKSYDEAKEYIRDAELALK